MSKVKDAVKKEEGAVSWRVWARNTSASLVKTGLEWGKWAYMSARFIGWIVVTTGIVTALPLIFEIKREIAVEELENLQISQGKLEGRTPQELAQNGLTAAIAPAVLS